MGTGVPLTSLCIDIAGWRQRSEEMEPTDQKAALPGKAAGQVMSDIRAL